jgi:hypothetical protein
MRFRYLDVQRTSWNRRQSSSEAARSELFCKLDVDVEALNVTLQPNYAFSRAREQLLIFE